MGVAIRGIGDGIMHVFSDYRHLNDWDEEKEYKLNAEGVDPIVYFKGYASKIESIYGIDFKADHRDFSFLSLLVKDEADVNNLEQFQISQSGKSSHHDASYAQYFEGVKAYDKALEYWVRNLEGGHEHNNHFFYHRRPIELLAHKMKKPKAAIKFCKDRMHNLPEFEYYFKLQIAKISVKYDVEKNLGREALKFCLRKCSDNYDGESCPDSEWLKYAQKKWIASL